MTPLPIDPILPEVIAALAQRRSAVLVAAPGAGKTTRVPPAILAANLLSAHHPNLLLLQPRRVAARAAAARIAEENGWELGRQVGYQVRFERVMQKQTRLRVLTEGILTRQLMDDPFLEGIGAVVLDEFHERSIHTDMAIALLREVRQSVRDDLILLVMSATLHAEPVAEFLGGCPILRAPGRAFDVTIEHRPPSGQAIEDRMAAEVDALLSLSPDQTGDVLAFLPGAAEIHRTQRNIRSQSDMILPLFGSLPFEQQVQALRPAPRRKVILATNIAETSLTIPGVRTVIDSGLARQAGFDTRRGMDQLQLKRISRASADQRAGRAGRTAPGRCIRLWTTKEHAALEAFDLPEIHRVDLSSTVLALHAWGKNRADSFAWFDPPPKPSLAAAERLLWMLGALTAEQNGEITPLGRRLLALPVHPRLGRLLTAAADAGLVRQGATLAALLSERDAIDRPPSAPMQGLSDLLVLMDQPAESTVSRLRGDLERMVGGKSARSADEAALLKLILLAYPDRVCRRRGTDPSTAVMVGGGGVRLARESVVKSAEFFVAVDVRQDDRSAKSEALVRLASAIEPQWLEECFPGALNRTESVVLDPKRSRVVGQVQTRYLDLILTQQADAAVDAADASAALAAALAPQAVEFFAADESAAALLARVDFLRKSMPEHPWPVFDATLLAEILTEACLGRRSVEEVKRQPLADFLTRRLPYPLDRILNEHAPVALQLPSGKSVRLRYEPNRPPVLAARLQELFGWTTTPRLAAGRVPVLLEILGPNYRPVQVTDDLAGFWARTYAQVRKDLRRRYPRHSWPEDPLTGIPPKRPGRI
jgi:ATP-dependent helicase HrpB